MNRIKLILKYGLMIAIAVVFLSAVPVKADPIPSGIDGVDIYVQGGILSNAPDYDWWYGCSPTSAGMMMGYYDYNGYAGQNFDNLVPGVVAELSTYPVGPTYSVNNIIASSGHITDFYSGGTGASGDDVTPPFHNFDCLADFMGTSQDSVLSGSPLTPNSNGSTLFYNFTDGFRFYDSDAVFYGIQDNSGMYGIGEYITYAGYATTTLYNQKTDNLGLTYGFTFNDYKDEIDAGRVVMLHVTGHSMFGYGYGANNTVYFHDTWNPANQLSMTWGTSYAGMDMRGVTVLTLVPVPGAVLLGILGLGVVGIKLRKYA